MSAAKASAEASKSASQRDVVERVFKHRLGDGVSSGGVVITRVAFYDKGVECMVVVSGVGESESKQVAFVTSDTWWLALVKLARLVEQGQLQWREDKWKAKD